MEAQPLYPLWRQDDLDAPITLLAEDAVTLGRLVQAHAMRDDERRVDPAVLDDLQQRLHVFHHVRLAHLEGEPLIHRGSHWDLVGESAVDAGDADDASLAAAVNCLAQGMSAVSGHVKGRLHPIHRRVPQAILNDHGRRYVLDQPADVSLDRLGGFVSSGGAVFVQLDQNGGAQPADGGVGPAPPGLHLLQHVLKML